VADEVAVLRELMRTGKETQIIDTAVVLSENVDIYGSLRTFAEFGAGDSTLNDGSSRIGYLGARFDDVGELSFGKQWSVSYFGRLPLRFLGQRLYN